MNVPEHQGSKVMAVLSALIGAIGIFCGSTIIYVTTHPLNDIFSLVFIPLVVICTIACPVVALTLGIISLALRNKPYQQKTTATFICAIFGICSFVVNIILFCVFLGVALNELNSVFALTRYR